MDPRHVPVPVDFVRRRRVSGPDGTRALGAALAGVVMPGDAILVHGELGAGKTCLIQGLGAALAVAEDVLSPTFTLVNRYHGRLILDHLDFYRIDAGADLDDIGLPDLLDELTAGRTVLVAEWPNLLVPLLPRRVELLAVVGPGPDERCWYARGVPDLPATWAALFPEEAAPC